MRELLRDLRATFGLLGTIGNTIICWLTFGTALMLLMGRIGYVISATLAVWFLYESTCQS